MQNPRQLSQPKLFAKARCAEPELPGPLNQVSYHSVAIQPDDAKIGFNSIYWRTLVSCIRRRYPLSNASVSTVLAAVFALANVLGTAQAAETEPSTNHQLLRTEPVVSTAVKSVREGYYVNPTTQADGSQAVAIQPETTKRNHSGHSLYDTAEIWVADVDVHVYNDSDVDGFFSGFSVNLDVDVEWHSADVFATFYLKTPNTEPQLLHSTLVFSIFERLVTDQYQVDVELVDNYPANDYDLIIDIVDAQSLSVVDTISFNTHRNLAGLPLESANYQLVPVHDPHQPDHGYTSTYIEYETAISFPLTVHHNAYHSVDFGVSARVVEYRGATGVGSLVGLLLVMMMRRRRPSMRRAS